MSEVQPAEKPPRLMQQCADGMTIVTFPRGQVDGTGVRELYELAVSLMDNRQTMLLLDFTGVSLMTSGTMGMLVTIRKKFLHTGAQLHVAVPDARVMEACRMLRLDVMVSFFETPEAARAAFKRG